MQTFDACYDYSLVSVSSSDAFCESHFILSSQLHTLSESNLISNAASCLSSKLSAWFDGVGEKLKQQAMVNKLKARE